jgi:hypothetical protein
MERASRPWSASSLEAAIKEAVDDDRVSERQSAVLAKASKNRMALRQLLADPERVVAHLKTVHCELRTSTRADWMQDT